MTLLRPGSVHPYYQAEEKHAMKPSTEDEVTGSLQEVEGTLKDKVEKVTDKPQSTS